MPGAEQTATNSSPIREKPRVSPAPEQKPASRSEAEHGGIYTHFRQLAALSGGAEPPPEQFSSLFGQAEFSHPVNNAQRARVLGVMQQQYGNRYVGKVVQRKCECGGSCSGCSSPAEEEEKKLLQRHSEAELSSFPDTFSRTMQSSGAGSSLDFGTKTTMESNFGHRF